MKLVRKAVVKDARLMDDTSPDEPSASRIEVGLTQEEATRRLADYGPNEVPEKKTSPLIRVAKGK